MRLKRCSTKLVRFGNILSDDLYCKHHPDNKLLWLFGEYSHNSTLHYHWCNQCGSILSAEYVDGKTEKIIIRLYCPKIIKKLKKYWKE